MKFIKIAATLARFAVPLGAYILSPTLLIRPNFIYRGLRPWADAFFVSKRCATLIIRKSYALVLHILIQHHRHFLTSDELVLGEQAVAYTACDTLKLDTV